MRVSRTKRRWRREYFPGRAMVWRRDLVFDEVTYAAGDPIPDGLNTDRGWLRRNWLRKITDFADQFPYEAGDPRSPAYVPPEPTLQDGDGGPIGVHGAQGAFGQDGVPGPADDGAGGGGEENGAGAGDLTTDSPADGEGGDASADPVLPANPEPVLDEPVEGGDAPLLPVDSEPVMNPDTEGDKTPPSTLENAPQEPATKSRSKRDKKSEGA